MCSAIKFLWVLRDHPCPPPLIFPSFSAPITVFPQIMIKLCSFTKKSKTGDASYDECSFCRKAGEKHCSIFIAVQWKNPQATVPLRRHDDMVSAPGNMQSALGYSPSLWCSQSKLSRRYRQSLAIDLQQAPQQALMSFIFLVSPSRVKA